MVAMGGFWLAAGPARAADDAAEKAKQQAAANEILKAKIRNALEGVDTAAGYYQNLADDCARMVDRANEPIGAAAARGGLDDRLMRSTFNSKSINDAVRQAEAVATSAEAKQPADKACGSAAAQSKSEIKAKIEAALAGIAKPFDHATLTAIRDAIQAGKASCIETPNLTKSFLDRSDKMSASDRAKAGGAIPFAFRANRDIDKALAELPIDPGSLELQARSGYLQALLVKASERIAACRGQMKQRDDACNDLVASPDLGKIQNAVGEAEALETRGAKRPSKNSPAC